MILIGPISTSWCQVDIANWHRHVFHLQYISNDIPISKVISLQYRHMSNVYWESISSEACSVEPRGVLQNRWPAPEFKNTSLLSTSGLLLLNSFDTTSDCLHESFESNVFVGITEIIFCGIIRIYTPRWHVKSNLKNVK